MPFCREVRFIYAVMSTFGWLPARCNKTTGLLEIRVRAVVYSVLMAVLQLTCGGVMMYKGIKATQQHDIHLHMLCYLQVGATSVPQIFPAFALFQASSHVALCNQLTNFQIATAKNSPEKKMVNFGLKCMSRNTSVLIVSLLIFNKVVRPLLLGKPQLILTLDMYFVFTLSTMNIVILSVWWIAVFKAVSVCSDQLLLAYKDFCQHSSSDHCMLHFKPVWLNLCTFMVNSGNALSLASCSNLLLSSTYLLMMLYKLITVQYVETALFFTFWTVLLAFLIYIPCYTAHLARKKMYNNLIAAIACTKQIDTLKIRKQMLRFLLHLVDILPEVTLSGYVVINRALVSTMIAAILTNLIVLWQLKIPETQLSVKDFFSLNDNILLFH